MKIIAAATARNILKNKEKRYDKIKKDTNDIITACANSGRKGAGFYIGTLDDEYIDRLLKELKEAGYVIENVEYMGRTQAKTMNVYIAVSWAGV